MKVESPNVLICLLLNLFLLPHPIPIEKASESLRSVDWNRKLEGKSQSSKLRLCDMVGGCTPSGIGLYASQLPGGNVLLLLLLSFLLPLPCTDDRWRMGMGQIPQDRDFGQNVAFFFLKVEPSCDQT